MFRILRFGLLALTFALPLALPQASEASGPRCWNRCAPAPVRCDYYRGHYHYYHGHYHCR